MKRAGWAGVLLSIFLLGGCAFPQGGLDDLLTPPKLNEEQNEIYAALTRDTGSEIKLLYPQKGKNRSAFLVANLDDEPTSEALVFYQSSSVSSVASSIHLNLLDKQDGTWRSVYDLPLDGTQIEDISLLNVGTGIPLVLVGITRSTENSNLKIFSFSGTILEEVYASDYQAKVLFDIDSDGQDEVITVNVGSEDVPAQATLLSYTGSGYAQTGAAPVNPSVIRYSTITTGFLKNGQKAVFLDGYCSGSQMITQILGTVPKEEGGSVDLTNLTFPVTEALSVTDRSAGITCYDVDNDSVIEVPGMTLLPGYTEDMPTVFYLTDWYNYLDGEYRKLKSSYVNSLQGYMFDFPERWIGTVSVRKTTRVNETLFYVYDPESNGNTSGQEILYIQMAKRSDWEAGRYGKEYQVISSFGGGQIVYLAKVPATAPAGYQLTLTQVKSLFSRYY